MDQIRFDEVTERHTSKVEDTRLRAQKALFAASDLLCSQLNESERLSTAGRRQQQIRSVRDFVLSNHAITIALHFSVTQLVIIARSGMFSSAL